MRLLKSCSYFLKQSDDTARYFILSDVFLESIRFLATVLSFSPSLARNTFCRRNAECMNDHCSWNFPRINWRQLISCLLKIYFLFIYVLSDEVSIYWSGDHYSIDYFCYIWPMQTSGFLLPIFHKVEQYVLYRANL